MNIYCVYLTVYRGNKLPPFYIGSTSVARVQKGYHGSVMSRKYKAVWRSELKQNPHLFRTYITKTCDSRKAALAAERYIQSLLRVVESPMYINQAVATVDGQFGISLTGKDHPLYGKQRDVATRRKISLNHQDMNGSNNTNAKTIIVTTPIGKTVTCYGNFKRYCTDNNLPYSTMNRILKQRIWPGSGPCVGYDVTLG